jgi:CspA family cold shock protein
MATGTVKWFSNEQGLRLHHARSGRRGSLRALLGHPGSRFKTLAEGAKVEFEVTQGQKGPQATEVQAGGQ